MKIRIIFVIGLLCLPGTIFGGRTAHCGPDRVPFDPDKQGCCKKADGTYEITDNPQNVNVCALDAMQEDACKQSFGYYTGCIAYGATICYNGKKYSCLCSCKGIQNTALAMCILAHEEKHVHDDNWACSDCDAKMPDPVDKAKSDRDHCTMYREDIACAKGISGWENNPEIQAFINDIASNLAFCQ